MTSPLHTGDIAPDFTLPSQDGSPVTLGDLLAKGPVVVFFYPKDGTPGCTQQMCEFGLQYGQFNALGASIVGISSDSETRHAKAHQQHSLPFPLLSDCDQRVRKAWGVPKFIGLLPHRVTYTLASNGTVVHQTTDLFNATRHITEALSAVKTLSKP